MKTTIRLLALVSLAASAGAQQKVSIERAALSNVSVRLNGALANVRIIGWDNDEVMLTGGLAAGSRLEGGPISGTDKVSGMKFYVDATDEAVARGNKLELHVPRGARVWVKAGSADISVEGVKGSLDLNIIGGSVKVAGEPRDVVIESMDGDVTFDGTAGFARIKTATGNISLRAGGEDVTVNSISGMITVVPPPYAAAFERARFETVTGGITFGGDIKRGGDIRFDTHSGVVELRLASDASAEFDVATITGKIDNSLTQRRPNAGREGRGMELVTSSGIGGARVQVRSFKGNVKLTTR